MFEVLSLPKVTKRNKKIYNVIDMNCNGVSKQIWRARKEHKCDFCGNTIFKGDSYVSTVDFVEHRIVKSCDKCHHGIITLYGD